MKKIEALLDGKDLTTDWVEDIYDLNQCVVTDNQAIGFVCDIPVYATWYNNRAEFVPMPNCWNDESLRRKIKERLTNEFADSDVIAEVYVVDKWVSVLFYFKSEED